MRYVMLIYETPSDFASRSPTEPEPHVAAWRAYLRALVAAGAYVGGAPLQGPGNATTIRGKGGPRCVPNGPFSRAQGAHWGFLFLEFESLDAALSCGCRWP